LIPPSFLPPLFYQLYFSLSTLPSSLLLCMVLSFIGPDHLPVLSSSIDQSLCPCPSDLIIIKIH
jgi:hypothetical protein